MTTRLTTLQAMHKDDPADADLPYMIALEHAKADDPAEAVRWLDMTLSLNDKYLYAYFQKAKMLSELGEDAEGCAVLDTGIAQANAAGDAKASSEMVELRQVIAQHI